jgi:hypothetical protein
MRTTIPISFLLTALFCLLLASFAVRADTEKLYFALEMNNTLCGYSEINISRIEDQGRELILLEQKQYATFSALGSQVEAHINLTYHIDPATGQFTYHDRDVKQGDLELGSEVHIEDGKARFIDTKSGDERTIELPSDVTLENTVFQPHLVRDFVTGRETEKTYQLLDVREMEIHSCTYSLVRQEEVELDGNSYDTIVLEKHIHETGVRAKLWIDKATGRSIKTVLPNKRMSYLTTSSVVKKVRVADMNESITTKANVSIADFKAISYMKVRAVFQPTGLVAREAELSVPGQRFSGTVKDNRIEGVFEIEHTRYDGANAPPFPPDFSGDDALEQFLGPESFLEADDPVLIEEARRITKGSKDSWEAAVRLGTWVAENISYAIPGGGTARKTYDVRAGECGSHSILLAAFCRAVGIPARVVWGCMYTLNFGGSFGQHAWNEIYMGGAGWIPIDATAFEADYIDSGHIRIGAYISFSTAINIQEIEILDYRLSGGGSSVAAADKEAMYEPYVGDYKPPQDDVVFKVFIGDARLTVELPNKIALALEDPDEEGRWFSRIAPHVYCTFETSDKGDVEALYIHEIVRMPRKADPEEIPDDVPEEFRPYLGVYRLAAVQADFAVRYVNGSLAIDDPLEKVTVGLHHPDEKGGWLDEFDKNTIYFEKDDGGTVTTLKIDSRNRFERQ